LICHEKKIAFWASQVVGFRGYIFCDLDEHQYTEEQQLLKDGVESVRKEEKMVKFKRFGDIRKRMFNSQTFSKKIGRKLNPLFFAMSSILILITSYLAILG
jgi:hypothetical protein